jgi:threonine dehydratase
VEVPESPTLSESTAGGLEPGSVTLEVCKSVVDRAVFVSESEIAESMKAMLETEHWLVEGAAAVAVAAQQKEKGKYKNAAIILCGRNLSPEAYQKVFGHE